jgi:membrane protease YdiL (CAAX protease family)
VALAAVRGRLAALTWVQRSLLTGAVIFLGILVVPVDGLSQRLLRDVTLFVVGPVTMAVLYGKNLGWRVDRKVLRNTLLLAAFVFPFYIVGSTLPTVRAAYPMWHTTTALSEFLPHTVMQFVVVVATECYYRGLLCVGVRELGPKSIFISPILYTIDHANKPPIELLLAGPTDVLFGAVDYDARSILPSIVAHGGGFVLLDWLVLHDPLFSPDLVMKGLRWLPLPL